MRNSLLVFSLLLSTLCSAQSYKKFQVGNAADVTAEPKGGVCLMGGSTENDEAMRWFLRRANGGDVVVLRASGGDGYNNYFLNELGIPLNSVTTFVCSNVESGSAIEIIDAVNNAEAIWFAGGDQWKYISYWRNTPLNEAINNAINRKAVIGGTSAGMAILGGNYYTAEKNSVNSFSALKNPLDENITLDSVSFLQVPYLDNVLTDTHFSERERKGRLAVFLANLVQNNAKNIKAIACDEKVAVCILENGWVKVFAIENETEKAAYFVTGSAGPPEIFSAGKPLTWNYNKRAVNVFKVMGKPMGGDSIFNAKSWQFDDNSGSELIWFVENGTFFEYDPAIPLSLPEEKSVQFYPNPVKDKQLFLAENNVYDQVSVYTVSGKFMNVFVIPANAKSLNISELTSGKYVFVFQNKAKQKAFKMVIE